MGIFKRPRIGFPLSSLDVKGINDFFEAVMYKLTGNIDFGDLTTGVVNEINSKISADELAAQLVDYVTNTVLSSALSDKVTTSALTTALANYITSGTFSSTLANYVTNSNLTTKLGQDYIITGKILANQIAAGILTGFTINAINTLNIDGTTGDGWASLRFTSLQGKHGSMYANNVRGWNAETDTEYGFNTSGAPIRSLGEHYRNWTDRLVGISEFGSNKSANGWSGSANGVILQWGTYSCGAATNQPWTVNFPVTFPNQCFGVVVGSNGIGNADGRIFRSRDENTISFKIVFDSFVGVYDSNASVKWHAIGY